MITGRLTKKGFEITRFVPTKEQSVLYKLYKEITRVNDKGIMPEPEAPIRTTDIYHMNESERKEFREDEF